VATTPIVLSAAKTTTGQTGTLRLGLIVQLNILANVTAVSGTTPTLTLSVEWSHNAGTTWFKADPADAFTQITATGAVTKQFATKAEWFRVVWTIGGTTPSFTFTLDTHYTPV